MADKQNIVPRLLKVPEAASYLCISQAQMWKLVYNGEIKSVRIGRSVRIDREDLDAMIDRAKTETIDTTS